MEMLSVMMDKNTTVCLNETTVLSLELWSNYISYHSLFLVSKFSK